MNFFRARRQVENKSKSEKVPVRSLAKLFASKLSDNEWLKQQLSKISIPIPEDTVEDCVAMPDYCPKLNTLYDLILSGRLSTTFFIINSPFLITLAYKKMS